MKLIFTSLLFVLTNLAWAQNQQFGYEPEVVKLSGKLRSQIFPGPPGYESVKNGDVAEKALFLDLSAPIDVIPVKGDANEMDTPEKEVKTVQIAIMNDGDWKKIKEGKYFCIEGTLFHEHTAHHHAPILIAVNQLNECKPTD